MYSIGIDLGGTVIKTGLMQDGKIIGYDRRYYNKYLGKNPSFGSRLFRKTTRLPNGDIKELRVKSYVDKKI
jgi:activator of 2-hydroxyglutaryl-CoA dehydratase